jgi:hypothetical protein
MKYLQPVALTAVLCAALGLGSPGNAAAATLLTPAVSATVNAVDTQSGQPNVIKVQKVPGGRVGSNNSGNRGNRNRRAKRRFYNPGVFLDGGFYNHGGYYNDPYYDNSYNEPYYNAPSYGPARYSCGDIRGMLRQQGYRHIQAHDCTGKVYTFVAYAGHKRYKLRIRSKNGSIKTRKRL